MRCFGQLLNVFNPKVAQANIILDVGPVSVFSQSESYISRKNNGNDIKKEKDVRPPKSIGHSLRSLGSSEIGDSPIYPRPYQIVMKQFLIIGYVYLYR